MKRLAPIAAALLSVLLFCTTTFAQDLPPESEESDDITVFTGDSEQEIDVSDFREPSLVRIWGYSGYLGVTDDKYNIDLFGSTAPFYGEYLLNYFIDKSSASIKVTSRGDWRIEITPLENASSLELPGTLSGAGNSVVLLKGKPSDSIRIQTDGRNDVNIYGYGDEKTLLLGTEAAVDAIAKMDESIQVITVKSQGEWTILTAEPNATSDTITNTLPATSTASFSGTLTDTLGIPYEFVEIDSNLQIEGWEAYEDNNDRFALAGSILNNHSTDRFSSINLKIRFYKGQRTVKISGFSFGGRFVNPGQSLPFELSSPLESKEFDRYTVELTVNDWKKMP